MVLFGDAREQFQIGSAVTVSVLQADLREDAGHQVGAGPALQPCHGAEAPVGLPSVVRLGLRSSEKAGAGKLFHPDSQTEVGFTGS